VLLTRCEVAVDIIFNHDVVTLGHGTSLMPPNDHGNGLEHACPRQLAGGLCAANHERFCASLFLWVCCLLTAVFHERWKLLTGSPVSRKKTRRRLLRLMAVPPASLSRGFPP